MFFRTVLIPLWFSNNLMFFPIINKHEGDFHNSETMEFVRLIHARSIGFWWDSTYMAFSLIYWLLCLINLLRSMTYTRLFYAYLLTFVFHEINRFITQVCFLPLIFIQVFCFDFHLISIDLLINCHDCFILLVETHF